MAKARLTVPINMSSEDKPVLDAALDIGKNEGSNTTAIFRAALAEFVKTKSNLETVKPDGSLDNSELSRDLIYGHVLTGGISPLRNFWFSSGSTIFAKNPSFDGRSSSDHRPANSTAFESFRAVFDDSMVQSVFCSTENPPCPVTTGTSKTHNGITFINRNDELDNRRSCHSVGRVGLVGKVVGRVGLVQVYPSLSKTVIEIDAK